MPGTDEIVLEGEELQQAGPCLEEGVGRVIVPSRGKLFASDGSVNVAVIRPCVSRGKRLAGLPPIYEPGMLGRNAGVFEDWHMWMGHMSQPVKEALEEIDAELEEATGVRRLFSELGGRVAKTWYDPDFRAREDDSNGYRPGAVMGRVIPYPAVKPILEADPDGLHVSIAAWPTAARSGSPSWDSSVKGMNIEGFRRKPRGSVDWVLRGGAGGRPVAGGLTEAEAAAVSAVGSYYSPARRKDTMGIDLKTITAEALRAALTKDNPALAEELIGAKAPAPVPAAPAAPVAPAPAVAGTVTREELDKALADQRKILVEELTKGRVTESEVDEAVSEALAESRAASTLEQAAHRLIKASGLPAGWREDLTRAYSVGPAGVPATLLCEADTDSAGKSRTAEEVLREELGAHIQHARDLIAESAGRPVVRNLGDVGTSAVRASKAPPSAFRNFLSESGLDLGDKPDEKIRELVMEGMD